MKRICKTCDINELPKGKQYCGDCAEKSKIRICKNCGVIKLPKGKQYCDDCVHDDERQAKLPSSNKVYIYTVKHHVYAQNVILMNHLRVCEYVISVN